METAATRHANKIDVKRHSKGPQSYAYTRANSNKLLVLAAIVPGALPAFDVTLALRGNFVAEGSSYAIRLLLAVQRVMLLCQMLVFSPSMQPLIAPALGVIGACSRSYPNFDGAAELAVVIGAIAAAAGMAATVITYWTALVAGRYQGDLGRWTAVTSLGQATGSAAAGLFLFARFLSQGMRAVSSRF